MFPPSSVLAPLQAGLGSAAGAVAVAGALVLLLMLVALGGIAYRSLAGDGIEWPGDADRDPDVEATGGDAQGTGEDGGVQRGGEDDEWKYY